MADTAYVFIYLPGAVKPIVAGRFELDSTVSPAVGRFVYGESYLRNESAVPLDPVVLPLREQLFTTTLCSGFFGVIRDAIPDDWGRHVASNLYGSTYATFFDYLWLPAADRMGALAFGKTSASPIKESPVIAWKELENTPYLQAIRKLDSNVPLSHAEEQVALLFGAGTSAGGARPKFTTHKDGSIWLAKLNRQSDRFNEVRVEAAMLDLATACGVRVPEHQVVRMHGQDVLLVRRFDRVVTDAGIVRHRMVSAGTVFLANDAAAQYSYTGSYPRLSRELTRWTVTGEEDRRQLFRRIAFNALTSATDDHERNHALVAEGPHFRLSPAFDLVPRLGNTRRKFLALAIGDYGALAVRDNLLSSAESFGLSRADADQIVDEVKQAVQTRWREIFAAWKVSASDVKRIAGCFSPPSFEDQPAEQPTL
ncbi:type II toxin-antitoxin system HipA family toxin [Steroidobacter sp.]|uniref:type II toxin-antitoxin system HipA family toxin n=1 Tax=Steroidobacter sp. TaxID=1978227 RepID=UPI001A387446|nr:HipA domain-containing protein [Steroidobacter sp.]MBL8271875.1 type II toxin-antitoxin system HipA family toxin [Steroidobacter sp.]